MTTSVYFNDFDFSELDYDVNSTDDNMLSDPSASIFALQRLRILKTRETGDDVVTPDTTGRDQVTMLDYNQTSYEQYRMRRKAEVLKYKKNTTINKKTNYSALVLTRRRQIADAKIASVINNSENDIIRVKKATNSGIRGDNSLLFLNPNVSFNDKL